MTDQMMEDVEMENGEEGKKQGWRMWRKTVGGKVVKRKKKTTLEKSLKLKKYVQPKNAVMCLNELIPGIVFNVEQESRTPGQPTQVSVTVDGQKYHGFGSSKQMAKQAAAEVALVSFVKPPSATGGTEEAGKDTTPWAILASFAMFKLFNEWREGRFGVSPITANPFGSMMPPDSMMAQTFQTLLGASMPGPTAASETKVANSDAFAAYLGSKSGETKVTKKEDSKAVPNPAKQVPENAASIHPVMLLHQMRPNLQFDQSNTTKDNKKVFVLKAIIDSKVFTGEGINVKKAKLDLATKANQALYGVVTEYVATA